MANFLNLLRPQGILVIAVTIFDWIFVLMNTTTMIPCRHAS